MQEEFCKGRLEAIMGAWIVLENFHSTGEMPLVCPFPQRGNEESLLLDTLTQAVRHTDCGINPARHTDGYARSPSPVSQKKARPQKQMLQHRSYNTL